MLKYVFPGPWVVFWPHLNEVPNFGSELNPKLKFGYIFGGAKYFIRFFLNFYIKKHLFLKKKILFANLLIFCAIFVKKKL